MVIEHDPSVVTMVTMILMRSGYQVIASVNGDTEDTDILDEKPDVILWDNAGQSEGVFPFLNELKPESETSIPIILLTDPESPEEIKTRMSRLRAKDYIIKPFSSKELLEKIAGVLCA